MPVEKSPDPMLPPVPTVAAPAPTPPPDFDLHTRVGHFQMREEVVRQAPDIAMRIYSVSVPVRVEHRFAEQVFDVTALSRMFDPLQPGEPIPWYDFGLEKTEDEATIRIVATRRRARPEATGSRQIGGPGETK